MIGMLNGGNTSDVPVEFYSSPKRSSLFQHHIRRETLTYTEDGRILLDGNLKFQKTPEEMWKDLIMHAVCRKVICVERSRTKSKMRRLLEQISFQSVNDPPTITTADFPEENIPTSTNTSQQSSPSTSYSSSSSTKPYVTTIVIQNGDFFHSFYNSTSRIFRNSLGF